MAQTSYPTSQPESVAGLVFGLNPTTVISRAAEAAIEFGRAVVQGTDKETQAIQPSATGQVLLGVSIAVQKSRDIAAGTSANYAATESVGIVTEGQIYVEVDQTVSPGDAVFFRHTGAAADIGKFRLDADTAKADQITNARWIKGAAAGGIAVLEISLP